MNGYSEDRRQTAYSNSKLHSPVITWGLIAGLAINVAAGTAFAIRLEGAINVNSIDIDHTKELHEQDSNNIKDKLDDIREDQKEIKRLIREALKE